MRITTKNRAWVMIAAPMAAIALAASPAAAAGQSGGTPQQDPLNDAKAALLCQPEASLLRPTQACSVYDPATETCVNPYTEKGDSPGLFGLGVLGLL